MPPSESATLQVGELAQHRRPQQVGGGLHDVDRLQRDEHVDRRVVGGDHERRRRPDVQAHDRALVAARLPERVPVVGVEARVAELRRVLRERDRVAALGGDAAHLGGHRLRVPDRRQRERDEAAGIGAAPLVDVPVVVGLQDRERRRPCPWSGRRAGRRGSGTTGSTSSRARRWRPCPGRGRGCRSNRHGSRRTTSAPCRTPRAGGRRPRSARCSGSPCPRRRQTSMPSSLRTALRRDVVRTCSGAGRRTCRAARPTWSSTLTRTMSSSRTRLAPPVSAVVRVVLVRD